MTTADPSPPPRADGLLTEEQARAAENAAAKLCAVSGNPAIKDMRQVRDLREGALTITLLLADRAALLALIAAKDERIKAPDARHAPAASPAQEAEEMADALARHGFVRCDIPACNCGSWHPRFGLYERMREIEDALDEAGHPLCNDNGHLVGKALAALITERDALAAQVRRLRAPEQREGWTTVTDDPKTWPPDTADQVLLETDGFGDGHGPPSDCFRREARSEVARMICARSTPAGPRPSRWMPWPSPHVGAQEDGLLLGEAANVIEDVLAAFQDDLTVKVTAMRIARWQDVLNRLRATRQAWEGKA